MSNFWDFLWTAFLIFAFAAYLMILFSIIADLFRDRKLNGWYKALWVVFLVVAPYLTAFVYLIGRGRSMAERQADAHQRRREALGAHVREVAGVGAAAEIAHARQLFDDGTLTSDEFAAFKAKALA